MKPGVAGLAISAVAAILVLFSCRASTSQITSPDQQTTRAYLGFDLNIFPGKDALPILRKTFAFSGYWLSPPPGEKTNTWTGQRELLRAQGFGFLLLYRGPASSELKSDAAAAAKGTGDAR